MRIRNPLQDLSQNHLQETQKYIQTIKTIHQDQSPNHLQGIKKTTTIIIKRIPRRDLNLLLETQKQIMIRRRALHQDQNHLLEIQKEMIISITLETINNKNSNIKRDQLLILFLNLHQGEFNSNEKDQHLNLDQNPLQENNKKNVKIVLPALDHLQISKEMLHNQTLDRENLNPVLDQDLDLEKIGNKNNLIKLQNYGITKEETTMIIGIIMIETITTNLTSTEMIEEVVEEEEAVIIVVATKVATIETIIVEDITHTIITTITMMIRIIANYSMYPNPISRIISIVIIDIIF